MKDGRPVVYFFSAIIVLMFYWVINSHFIEIQEREELIDQLHETIIIQQEAIDAQKRQNDLLLQFYFNQTRRSQESSPLYHKSI